MARFRFGISGNAFGGIDELIDLAVRAERAGFDVITVADLPGAISPVVHEPSVAVGVWGSLPSLVKVIVPAFILARIGLNTFSS